MSPRKKVLFKDLLWGLFIPGFLYQPYFPAGKHPASVNKRLKEINAQFER